VYAVQLLYSILYVYTASPTSYNLFPTKYKLTYPYKATVCSHLIIRFDTVVEPETIIKLINRHLLCTFRVNAVHTNCALSLYAPRRIITIYGMFHFHVVPSLLTFHVSIFFFFPFSFHFHFHFHFHFISFPFLRRKISGRSVKKVSEKLYLLNLYIYISLIPSLSPFQLLYTLLYRNLFPIYIPTYIPRNSFTTESIIVSEGDIESDPLTGEAFVTLGDGQRVPLTLSAHNLIPPLTNSLTQQQQQQQRQQGKYIVM
jgi:hypothetical protein